MIKVLSIDGGGIRGIIPALILEEIENRTHKPISTLFNLITGTSTGGIISLALVKPSKNGSPEYKAGDIVKLYENEGSKIFSRDLWHTVTSIDNLLEEKYTNSGIANVLSHYFGDTLLSSSLTEVIIPSYEIELRSPWFFKSKKAREKDKDSDFFMRDVARATSAAPTYFEPISIKAYGGNTYFSFIDGGVFANNPSMCAYVEAKSMYKRDDILVVSLGVGEHTRPISYKNAKDWGLAMWAKPILGVVFDGVSSTVDYQLKELLPKINGLNRYYRFQSRLDIGSDEMDNTSKSNINALKLLAHDIINENKDSLDALTKQLTEI